jgi:hypothetical protein
MSITETVNEHEGSAEVILNENDTGTHQSSNPEPLTEIGPVIQQGSHETGVEHQSKISLRDVVVSLITVLSFTAILILIYWIHPS